jgi:hypothetical protein
VDGRPAPGSLPARLWVPGALAVLATTSLPAAQVVGPVDGRPLLGTATLLLLVAPGLSGVLASGTATRREAALVAAASAVAIVAATLGTAIALGVSVGCPPRTDPPAVLRALVVPTLIVAIGYAAAAIAARHLADLGRYAPFLVAGGIVGPTGAVGLLAWIFATAGCRPV